MIQFGFPYRIGDNGRTASVEYAEHIRELIEQLLFTSPGERVNRPTFGSGLLQAVFAPNSPEMAATLQFLAQTALQHWLGELIDLHGVEISSVDSTVNVTVKYAIKSSTTPQVAMFTRTV